MRNIILFITILLSGTLSAQEFLYEIGPTGGASFYSGDANNYALFQQPNGVYGISVRRNFNLRTALKVDLLQATVSSDFKDSKNILPNSGVRSFKTDFLNINAHLEYSFFSYSDSFLYKETRRFSPYIFIGLGVTSVTSPSGMTRLNIPMGVGVKYKIFRRVNIGAEWSMNMLMSDRLERIDALTDPYRMNQPSGIKNNDWFSYLKFYITFDFYRPPCNCNKN